MGREIELLGINAGYFLGYNGKIQKYFTNPLRSVIGCPDVERRNLGKIVNEISTSQPDIVGIVELDLGSIRTSTDGQIEYINRQLEDRGENYKAGANFKYRDISVLRNTPFLCSMANGALCKEGEIIFHNLERGWKRLMIEIKRDELSFFILHLPFSLFNRTRQRQLEEISEIIAEREKYVLFGDFNIADFDELQVLKDRNNVEICSPGETYPVYNPKEPYDLFILSPDIEMKECEVLDLDISDHKAVRATVEIEEKNEKEVKAKEKAVH